MHLAKVEVTNFRGLRHVTLELQPGLNVLVGRNNVGKTSLLSAIRHALGSAAAHGDSLWLSQDDFYRAGAPESLGEIEITLTFASLSADDRAFYYEIVAFDHLDIASSVAVVRFRASWNAEKGRAWVRRTGGQGSGEDAPEVPSEILATLPITFLPALRDAEAALAPGPRSRLATMLRRIADKGGPTARDAITGIFRTANEELEKEKLIDEARRSLRDTARLLSGSDYSEPAIRAGGVDFDRILRSLQILMPGAPIEGIQGNGLGYNNLLYMAVVLEHLRIQSAMECPLLLVEEPEAHLHPQLVSLLAEHLASDKHASGAPQTIVTTHSPTLVACIPTARVQILYADPVTRDVCCNALSRAGLSEAEGRAVARLMDVTRASLYFAKGVILVEGVSEQLLFPALARRRGVRLAEEHIAIIPMCGVAFQTFQKLFGPGAFGVRVAIVTDGDPPTDGEKWQEKTPRESGGSIVVSERTQGLHAAFAGHPSVRVFHSQVTLEYDLAEADAHNAGVITAAWEQCFERTPRTLSKALLEKSGAAARDRALAVWRGVCLASSGGSKADLAHRLAEALGAPDSDVPFKVPEYIAQAVEYVRNGAEDV